MITKDQVQHIAKLSKLSLSEEELQTYAGQISAVLNHFEQLNKIDTKNIEPLYHASPIEPVLREDIVIQRITVEEAMSNAPDRAGQLVKVPVVVG